MDPVDCQPSEKRQRRGLENAGAGGREVVGGQGNFLAPSQGNAGSFQRWLLDVGAWWDETLVEIRSPWREYSSADKVPSYLRDGWGLMSRNKKIKKGTVICKVPKEASFRSDGGTGCSEDQDSQFHLAIRLLREQRKGSESELWPKIATLPGGVPVCWAWKKEEQEWLAGTELEIVMRRKLERLHTEFCDLVEPLGKGWSEAEYLDACATIISHANPWWGVSSVSFVDMGNHDDDPHVEFRQKGNYVVGTVVKTIPKLSEIYQSYGEVGSADLLYRYGFTREGPDAHIPRPEDVVSIDADILCTLMQLEAKKMQERVNFLKTCSVLEESPWDGLEDVLTIQLAVHLNDDTDGQAGAHGAAIRVSGLSELLVGCLVMTMEEERWQLLQGLYSKAQEVLGSLGMEVVQQDVDLLALFLSLDHMHQGGGTELGEQEARSLASRMTEAGITFSPPDKASDTNSREEEDEDDDDDDDVNELDWMSVVGDLGQHASWLPAQPVVAAARRALVRRKTRLVCSLPALSGEGAQAEEATVTIEATHPQGSAAISGCHTAEHTARLQRMARRIYDLETAVLDAAECALSGIANV